jgi:hypothetical protein
MRKTLFIELFPRLWELLHQSNAMRVAFGENGIKLFYSVKRKRSSKFINLYMCGAIEHRLNRRIKA